MKSILTLALFLFSIASFSQTILSGKVVDEKGKPVAAANIYIEGSYDGTSTNENGEFNFSTSTNGSQTLVVSFLIYETSKTVIDVAHFQNKTIKLKESITTLDAVVITAGNLEAGDKARVSVLKPLDIVTTAGNPGDIISALQTLPGVQTVGESGKLFVRGGEADETQTFIDGIRVAQPYLQTANNIPTRSRFSPFLFKGTTFSTGGYSAEFGEALSSVLLLNTIDEPDQEKTDIGLMTLGLSLGNTQKWTKNSFSFNSSYINLAPYLAAFPDKITWNKPYQSLGGESVFRHDFDNGLLKIYVAFDASRFDLNQENVNYDGKIHVVSKNDNFYTNASYKGSFGGNWNILTGFSFGKNQNKGIFDVINFQNKENASQLKLKLTKSFSDRIKTAFGTDYFNTQYEETYANSNLGLHSSLAALYSETDIFFSKKLAVKIGFRASRNYFLQETAISPRASMAYKLSKNGQFSMAYGTFQQAPKTDYLKLDAHLQSEKTQHYILNYQYNKDKQTFRAEAYYKNYDGLVKYDGQTPMENSIFSNKGSGYAKGLDLFWRDNKNIKNLEYWVSYSYIDTERDYKNYTKQVTPNFVANHSLSVVSKYWISDWRSQIGATYSLSSARPYNNPNEAAFMNGKTKPYNNLSMNWAYLISPQKILFFSVTNIAGFKNSYGYDYANKPNSNGIYQSQEIIPTADRFFFVGFFWTISKDKKTSQLENL